MDYREKHEKTQEILKKQDFLLEITPMHWAGLKNALDIERCFDLKTPGTGIRAMIDRKEIFRFPRSSDYKDGQYSLEPVSLDRDENQNLEALLTMLDRCANQPIQSAQNASTNQPNENASFGYVASSTFIKENDAKFDTQKPNERRTVQVNATLMPGLAQALDVYSRIGIGQFEEIAQQMSLSVREGFQEYREHLEDILRAIKAELGYPMNASLGILADGLSPAVQCAWDLKKVIERAYAIKRDEAEKVLGIYEDTGFRGVNYDGLIVSAAKNYTPPSIKAK